MSRRNVHILIFPFPAQGHMLPLLDLTHQLSIRCSRITILVTPKNVPLLNPLLSKDPSIQTLVLPFPSDPSIPPGVENMKDLPPGGFQAMMVVLTRLRDPVKCWFRNHPSPPTAVVFDFFLGWADGLARELGIPGYLFSPSGALTLSLVHSLWRNLPKRANPNDDNEIISFPGVPNRPAFPWWQISPGSYAGNPNDPVSGLIRANFLGGMASSGLVINTAHEFEQIYLDHLKQELGHERVWAVGPVLPSWDDQSGTAERGGLSSIRVDEVVEWLDDCEDPNSVVFVCFGSQAVLTSEQLEALTSALEKSGVKFVLSVKGASKGHKEGEKYGSIPICFEERVSGRGLVIKGWAPQVFILRHRSVGAFLTHCGWNSVLEGITAGVPMLAWPMGADQFTNATLIVDEMKIGWRVCEGAETVPDSDELAGTLARAAGVFQDERRRACELQKAALDAVQKGGNSFKSLDHFALHLVEMSSSA